MKSKNPAALSVSASLGRVFPAFSIFNLLPILLVCGLVLIAVAVWWKMASRSPIYLSLAKVMVKESVQGSKKPDLVYWVLKTLTSPELLKRATKRTQALNPQFPPSTVDLDVLKEKSTGVIIIFSSGSDLEYTSAYLESVIDELMIMRTHSPLLGELSVLERPTRSFEDEKFLRLVHKSRSSS